MVAYNNAIHRDGTSSLDAGQMFVLCHLSCVPWTEHVHKEWQPLID